MLRQLLQCPGQRELVPLLLQKPTEMCIRDRYQHEHLFALPGFYYGRFVGAVSAMELLLLAQEDWTAAADRYLALISQPGPISYELSLIHI